MQVISFDMLWRSSYPLSSEADKCTRDKTIRQVVAAYKRLKQRRIIELVSEVLTVANEGWSFTRDSNYRVLLEKILVFWIDRRMWEMAPYMRWSHIEVQLSALVWACLGFSEISEMRWQKLFYFKSHSYFETYGLKIHRIF